MKKLYPFFLLIFFTTTLFAQKASVPVRFASGNFTTGNNINQNTFSKATIAAALSGENYFVLLQFAALPAETEKLQLKNAGIELGDYIPGNAFFATIKNTFDFTTAFYFHIISINTVPASYKIETALRSFQKNIDKQDATYFAVSFFSALDKKIVEAALQQTGASIVPSKFNFSNTILIQSDVSKLNAIAALPFVTYISRQTIKDRILNYTDVSTHAISSVQSISGRNLQGKNTTVGVGDNAEISASIDFAGRLINRDPFPLDYHGTHTSGTTAGAGIVNVKYRGMAPKATLVSQWFSDILTNTGTYVTDHNMIATNNSYYSVAVGCPGEGVYDVLSRYLDSLANTHNEVLHVIAAGNDGTLTCTPYPNSFGTVKSGWQSAKNIMTVGGMDAATYLINYTSSRGPVKDGRIKPEIVTKGVNTFSTWPFNTYAPFSGTSMAAPVITGVTALLQERYKQLNGGTNAKAALLKALMCNNAEDLGNAGPDYTYGFGMLNVRKAIEALEGNQYFLNSIATGQNQPYSVTVPANARRLKVMLYWADYPAAAGAANALVNDLDVTITSPSFHQPLILNTTPANVNSLAAEGADHINNIEQIVIDNPVAGTYNINVNGFAVPQGPQTYYLTYQVDLNGITVEYPFGSETFVPGETETLRWTAYGNESNTFTIEYSDNAGSSWNLISNSVAASARSYDWTVPSTISNNYLIRISRNATALTDQSDYVFTVLGQTLILPSVPCQGYVQLDWSSVAGATSYDVLQLKGDSMEVIANTTALTYLVKGLNSTTEYWFSVRAKNNAVSGRRANSVNITPATGSCSLSIFDGNFKAVSIDAPVSGRQFTSSALTATEQIKLTIKNLDDVTSSGSYNLSYQIDGGSITPETVSVNIASLATYTYTFTTTTSFAATGTYTVKAWVTKAGDAQQSDDTVTTIIKHLANPLLVLPVTDGFETTTLKEYTTNTIGLDGDDRSDFKTSSTRGRARTFVNTGFALNGNRAITLDQFPYGALATDSLLTTWNINNYNSGNQLRVDFYYKNHGQAANPNNKVWIRGSDTKPWVFAYDLIANQADLGLWKHALINVNDVLDTALPAQPVSTSFQIKIGQQGNTSANVPNPQLDQDDGYTIDDIRVAEALGDVGITEIVSPSKTGCGLTNPTAVSIKLKNYTAFVINSVQVNYQVNGGPIISETIGSLSPGAPTTYIFTTPANLAAYIDYDIDFWISAPGDNYQANDSILNYTLHNSPVISSYPYLEGFESSDGYFYQKGTNSSWQWGTPAKTIINKAPNGSKAWVTNLTGNYNDNEFSYLYSPCFNLTGLTQPVLSFSHIFQVETDFDYVWVEYTTDGNLWQKLGAVGSGTNWYDNTGFDNWRLSKTKWHVASIDVPPYAGNVRFRIAITSDGGVNYEGVGIDDFHLFNKSSVYTGLPVTGLTQNVSAAGWTNFYSGSTIVAALNLNGGTSLGNTTVDVYPYSGTVRTSNNQYYLDRNIVIRPTNVPSGYVGVRFYFTEAEANNLLNASGCGVCTKPNDPYELGVTKYNGTFAEENGTLVDNLSGFYQYILPANTDIIPYDNGYYAEFGVNSFSEFWLNNGGTSGTDPLSLNLLSFEAVKQTKKVLLQWTTSNEVNTDKFIVERSGDGRNYIAIGNVTANNSSGISNYSLTDTKPVDGLNYYRLKMFNRDGTFKYSPVRKVNFGSSGDDITVYPNPVTGKMVTVTSSANCISAVLSDASGKTVRTFGLQGRTNNLDINGIAKGIYQLKITTANAVHSEKLVIQ